MSEAWPDQGSGKTSSRSAVISAETLGPKGQQEHVKCWKQLCAWPGSWKQHRHKHAGHAQSLLHVRREQAALCTAPGDSGVQRAWRGPGGECRGPSVSRFGGPDGGEGRGTVMTGQAERTPRPTQPVRPTAGSFLRRGPRERGRCRDKVGAAVSLLKARFPLFEKPKWRHCRQQQAGSYQKGPGLQLQICDSLLRDKPPGNLSFEGAEKAPEWERRPGNSPWGPGRGWGELAAGGTGRGAWNEGSLSSGRGGAQRRVHRRLTSRGVTTLVVLGARDKGCGIHTGEALHHRCSLKAHFLPLPPLPLPLLSCP